MLEDELRIALQTGSRLAPYEIPLLETIEEVVHGVAAAGCDCTAPEHLSNNRGMQQKRTLFCRERVQARGDDAAHVRRELVRGRGTFSQRSGELLEEQWVALSGLGQPVR